MVRANTRPMGNRRPSYSFAISACSETGCGGSSVGLGAGVAAGLVAGLEARVAVGLLLTALPLSAAPEQPGALISTPSAISPDHNRRSVVMGQPPVALPLPYGRVMISRLSPLGSAK